MAFVLVALLTVTSILYFFITGGIWGDRWIVLAVLAIAMFIAARKT